MDASRTPDQLAFELVFLDVPADLAALSKAAATLHATTVSEFTEAASATLDIRGVPPRPQRISGRRSTWFSRAREPDCRGWRFEVYLPGKWSNSRIQLWLLTDGTWALSTDPQVGMLTSTSMFQRTELTAERQHYLIDARAGRVANWLNQPKGQLNAAVA